MITKIILRCLKSLRDSEIVEPIIFKEIKKIQLLKGDI